MRRMPVVRRQHAGHGSRPYLHTDAQPIPLRPSLPLACRRATRPHYSLVSRFLSMSAVRMAGSSDFDSCPCSASRSSARDGKKGRRL